MVQTNEAGACWRPRSRAEGGLERSGGAVKQAMRDGEGSVALPWAMANKRCGVSTALGEHLGGVIIRCAPHNTDFSRVYTMLNHKIFITSNTDMGRSTRSGYRPSTPEYGSTHKEANTITRTRFYDAFDRKSRSQLIRGFTKVFNIPESTARLWLAQRRNLGSPAYRRLSRV